MKLLSVNTGLTREIILDGSPVPTGIYKSPVQGRIRMRTLNLDGDQQGDQVLHGGPEKAVCVYPAEHYEFWRGELPGMELPWGVFGENLTTEGLLEETIHLGDRLRVGSAEVVVTQPRMPCHKLGFKFGMQAMVDRVLKSGRTGFYLAVVKEGEIGSGDHMEVIHRDPNHVTLAAVTRLHTTEQPDVDLLCRALEVSLLPQRWRDRFRHKLQASKR
ncbi:MAG: MOSC domain-containing protein [Acidobacteria bacterium]|nr:MOSC domain-containing protein [Acidobacteriota bacterium]